MKTKVSIQQSGKIGRQDKPKNQEKVSLQVYNKWCHPSTPFFVIQVADTGSLYDGVIPVAPSVSSQCPDTGI
ncbi:MULTISPECIES: hypothetical protein [unclassified Wolbachia]|uniref:hypothetical protein n=1 Tax=unclassified Wolbachia TaxID=2640676 RepID=UPI0030CA27B6